MVKLLPCDHEVMGSSPGNSLLQKCRERLRTIDPKWSDPSPDPAQAGFTCTGLRFCSRRMLELYCTTLELYLHSIGLHGQSPMGDVFMFIKNLLGITTVSPEQALHD